MSLSSQVYFTLTIVYDLMNKRVVYPTTKSERMQDDADIKTFAICNDDDCFEFFKDFIAHVCTVLCTF